MSFGIAFSGGGTRGAAHVGVLQALSDNGMLPDFVAGTSAGSIVAGLFAMGITPKKLSEMVFELSKTGFLLVDADYKGILKSVLQLLSHKPITFSGFIKGNKLEDYFCQLTEGKSINDAKIRTVIPAVDLISGETIAYTNSLAGVKPVKRVRWETDVRICDAIRASIAVPAVFQPKNINDMCLVDGGVSDILPVNLLIAAGEKNVLAVDVGEDYKMPESCNIIEISTHSLSIMSRSLKDYISSGEKLLLKPGLPDSAGLLTFSHMQLCFDAGYEAVQEMISTIKWIFK